MSTTRRPHNGAVKARNQSFSPLKTGNFSDKGSADSANLIYETNYLSVGEKNELLAFLTALHPIWESRYSKSNPPPGGQERWLLRPVYWLGNWQFACLNYYHPPKGIEYRCVEAEPYPAVMQKIVRQIEERVRREYDKRDIPSGWQLNTCLVNYYGSRFNGDKWEDVARVGEHRDFEPGPVASVSFGERALFQFVQSRSKQHASQVVKQMWLDDNSLQIFGGERWKKKLFHRVQRVEKKTDSNFSPAMMDFQTRRLNLTFRYVPREHILPFQKFPAHLQADIRPSMETLAQHSAHFRAQLETARSPLFR